MNAQQLSRIKVATTYLSIIMLMSIMFSFVIYDISNQELTRQRRIELPGSARLIISAEEFEKLRQTQLERARDNLKKRLVIFNLLTLLTGAVASYFLALRSLKPIEEALEKQDRFTSDAAHEIRTPLTAMKSETEVVLRDKSLKLADAKDTLASNLEEINRLENLTTGLLKLARQEKTSLIKQTSDFKNIVSDAISQTKNAYETKKMTVKTDYPKTLKILAEPTSLTQCLVILLDNSAKYAPEKSEVKVTAKQSRTCSTITVSDNGPGINPADLPYIFDRFYRADKSRTSHNSNSGFGLGLAIAKQIITDQGGTISLKNQQKTGIIATITLPKK